jgi:hypothetical protein
MAKSSWKKNEVVAKAVDSRSDPDKEFDREIRSGSGENSGFLNDSDNRNLNDNDKS